MRIFKKTAGILGALLLIFLVSCKLSVNTPTPPATNAPQSTRSVSPTPRPSPLPTPKPSPSIGRLWYKGTGNGSILDVSLAFTVNELQFTHEGPGDFSVTDYYWMDERLLFNDAGDFQGSTLIYGDNKHSLKIEAEGEWEIKIEPLLMVADAKCSGKGCGVSQMMLGGGSEEWSVTNRGKGDFTVYAYYTNSGGNKCLLDTKGNYKGKLKIEMPETGIIIFCVVSDGEWTLERTKTEMED